VREYWIVDAGNPTVQVFRLSDAEKFAKPDIFTEDKAVASSVLEGFSLGLDRIFAD
jgi:Uma2 family endonuclease